MLHNLANVVFCLRFVGRCFDILEGIRGLDEDGVADDDLGVYPARGESGTRQFPATWSFGTGLQIRTFLRWHRTALALLG